ncbi:MAG: tetratricopeptide repeat protein, partial [Planctomycetes bacterium]|nr:tetratricopeptide repeat protein [Planctomycetota bacterium]
DRDDPSSIPTPFLALVALLGTDEQYTRLCRSLLPARDLGIAHICACRPNAVFAEHADALVAYVEDLILKDQSVATLNYSALVHYRAGNRARSLELLNQSSWKAVASPLRALLMHQDGDVQEARKALQEAVDVANRHVAAWDERNRSAFLGDDQITWYSYDWLWFLTLLREAEQAIDHEMVRFDALHARCEVIAKRKWTHSPETAAFDHAVLFGSIHVPGQSRFPQPYVARGQRLAALGRFDEAEADLRIATEIKPDDLHIAAAYGAILAERGAVARAADVLAAALPSSKAKGRAGGSWTIEDELARRDEVLEILLKRHPQDEDVAAIRGMALVRQMRWDEARRAYSGSKPTWRSETSLAPLALLLGDAAAFVEACRRQADLLRPSLDVKDQALAAAWQVETRALKPVDTTEAAELLERLEQNSDTAERPAQWWFAMGLAQYRNERFEEALESLGKARDPKVSWQHDARIWPVLAMAHWRLKRPDEARKWLARAEAWLDMTHRAAVVRRSNGDAPTSIWLNSHVLYLEAKALIDGGAAVSEVRQSLAVRAEAYREAELAGTSLRGQNTRTAIAGSAEPVLEDAADRHEELGKVLHQNGKLPEAEAEFRDAVRLRPRRVALYFELALVQREQKKYPEAEATLREAEKLNPPREKLLDALGFLFACQQERLPEAEAAFRAAIEADPRSVSAHCGLARTFELQGRTADAVEWWSATLRLEPQHTWAREARGWNLRVLKRYGEAEADFRVLIRQDPKIAGAHGGLGAALKDQGKLREAVEFFERGLRLTPNAGWITELAGALAGLGRTAEAESKLREFIRLQPDSSEVRCALAAFLLDQNRPEEAEIELRETLRLTPKNDWARALLDRARIDMLMAQARPAAERRDWKTAAETLGTDFETALPENHFLWFSLALTRVMCDDAKGYAKLAQAMPAAFAKHAPPTQWQLLDICRVCTLCPEGTPDPQLILGAARRLCEFERNSWNVFLLGLAHYRAGELEPALAHIEEACRIGDWYLFWPALAMVHHRLGHVESAQEQLQKAEEYFAQMIAMIGDRDVTATGDSFWQHWAYFEAMLREARTLIGNDKP